MYSTCPLLRRASSLHVNHLSRNSKRFLASKGGKSGKRHRRAKQPSLSSQEKGKGALIGNETAIGFVLPGSSPPHSEKGTVATASAKTKPASTKKPRMHHHVKRPIVLPFKDGTAPPIFVIDLDQPPETRWAKAVEWGAHILRMVVPRHSDPEDGYFWDNDVMRALEKRYTFSNEQYAELEGIAKMSNLPLRSLISFNLSLTHQFACTSGTLPETDTGRLLHFRLLDPPYSLPHLLIQAQFIRGGEYAASALLHLGHVAFATGVRKGLSISVNTNEGHIEWRSMSKILAALDWALYDPWPIVTRDLLLREPCPSLDQAAKELSKGKPNLVYLVLSDGLASRAIDQPEAGELVVRHDQEGVLVLGNHYSEDCDEYRLVASRQAQERVDADHARLRYISNAINQSLSRNNGVSVDELRRWIMNPPLRHGGTTLSCIMDPLQGGFLWSAAYESMYG